jgi:tRNA pseudouridine13 synthase
MFWISAYQSYVWNAMTSERIRRYGTAVVVGDLVENNENGQVTIVTSESLHSTTLRFDDVVLPLAGYDVLYPTNEVGERYRALLERDAVSFRKDGPPESTAKGSYRKLVSRAYNVSFEALAASGGDGNLDVKLQFDLPTGSYATMFLRELMYTTVVRDNRIGA